MYSPPDRPLQKKELGLVSVSPSVSVALVSTLATVSVHFCLCRLGLHTCHSVSPLLSLSPWSPHLPQCQSTASSSVSVTVRAVIPTAPLDESIVNGYRRYSQNSRSYLLPGTLTGVEPESSGEHLSPVTTKTSSQASLSELNVTVHVLFFASVRLPVNSRGGGPRSLGESPIGRLVLAVETACTCWTLIACQLHDGSLCCLSVHCVQHWQYLCLGPEACTRTDVVMTLQLYVTVVRCSQTGWIETTGLKKSLGSDGTSSVKHLAWLVIPQPPRHCRPCCCCCC